MAAVRAIWAGFEQTAREAARADVKMAARNMLSVVGVVAVEMDGSSICDVDVNVNDCRPENGWGHARD